MRRAYAASLTVFPAILLTACCNQPVKRTPPTVPLSEVLSLARAEFLAIPTYSFVAAPGSSSQDCQVILRTQPATLTVTLKTTGTKDVKAVVGVVVGGLVNLSDTYDYSRGDTGQISVNWQADQVKAAAPLSGSWSGGHGGNGKWKVDQESSPPTHAATTLPEDTTDTNLNAVVIHALRSMIIAQHADRCVYPTSIEIHRGFEVVVSDEADIGSKTIIWNAGVSLTGKDDVVQDFDLKIPFSPDSQTLQQQQPPGK
ncbi:hypothetical protein [Dyella humicola]|uniref:hypothetical protein n=1 Tax=Dyella humicola TaxID=2992126 RepID=UPI002257F12A|nr:hypothetical protein [Dyella humicola]